MMSLLRALPIALLFALSAMGASAQFVPTTGGQTAAEVPAPSPNDVKELLRLLGEPSVQGWLRDSAAETGVADNGPTLTVREQLDAQLTRIAARVQSMALAWELLPQMPSILSDLWETELSHAQKVRSLTYVLTFLLIGLGLEWLYRQTVRYPLLRVEQAPAETPLAKLTGAALRAAMIFAGLGVFALGSIGAFQSFTWHPLIAALVLDCLFMVLLFRSALTVSLFFQAPYAPELRLVPYTSPMARYLHRMLAVLALAVVIALALSLMLGRVVALDPAGLGGNLAAIALAQTVSLALAVVLVAWVCIWIAFRQVPLLMGNAPDTRDLKFWQSYMMILVGAVFALWLFGLFGIMWAALIVGLVIPSLRLMRAWIDHFFDQSTAALHHQHMAEAQAALDAFSEVEADVELHEGEPEPDTPEFADPYIAARPIVQRVARFVLLMSAVLILSSAWGVNIFDLSADRSVLGRIFEVLIDSIFALLLADLVWTWAKTLIDKRLADYEPPVDGQAPGPEARMITLLPLLRTILMAALLIMVSLSVLSAAGVNIAPILAGAGIMGIAIGFGTQSLVRDIVAGIFFLIDDAFRLGEYIEVGDLMGTVESISIRSMRIRHHRGKCTPYPTGS